MGFRRWEPFPAAIARPIIRASMGPTSTGGATAEHGTREMQASTLLELQRKLHKALGKEIERREVVLRMTPEGFRSQPS